jgi:DNA invertase Pin-like site-specific DNA recombinase
VPITNHSATTVRTDAPAICETACLVAELSPGIYVSPLPLLVEFRYVLFMGHLLGYARVSTTDQDASLQVDALNAAGCFRVFVDTMSGSLEHRPELDKLLDQIRPGDTLVVWRLDRLGRSIRHLIDQLHGLADRGVGFRSLQETIDTTSPGGRLVFHVFAALAEFERDLIKERTNAGLAAARARGRTGGRPPRLSSDQVRTARRLYEQQDMTVAQIGDVLGVSRTTIYRTLAKHTEVMTARRTKPSPSM